MRIIHLSLMTTGLSLGVSLSAATLGSFDIQLNFLANETGIPVNEARFQQAANKAAAFWESMIVGYHPDLINADPTNRLGDSFNITIEYSDRVGLAAADAVSSSTRFDPSVNTPGTSLVPTSYSRGGNVRLNVFSALSDAQLELVLRHEMGHTFRFSSFDAPENPFVTPTIPAYSLLNSDGNYIGAAGLAAYRKEFDPDATFVPLDNTGHLLETTAIVREDGLTLGDALMSPSLGALAEFTATERGIFEDMGFIIVPELAAVSWCLPLGAFICAVARRRRS